MAHVCMSPSVRRISDGKYCRRRGRRRLREHFFLLLVAWMASTPWRGSSFFVVVVSAENCGSSAGSRLAGAASTTDRFRGSLHGSSLSSAAAAAAAADASSSSSSSSSTLSSSSPSFPSGPLLLSRVEQWRRIFTRILPEKFRQERLRLKLNRQQRLVLRKQQKQTRNNNDLEEIAEKGKKTKRGQGKELQPKDGRDDDDDEEEDNSYHGFPATGLTAALHGLLSDRQRLARWSISGIQLALALYLGHAVVKAVTEILDDLIEEQGGTGGFGGSLLHHEPLAVKRDELNRVLSFLEQDEASVEALLLQNSNSLPSLQALQLANDLLAAGLPLRSSQSPSSLSFGDNPQHSGSVAATSVESLLSQLTRSELAVLRQCLWTPPPINVPTEDQGKRTKDDIMRDSVWNQISGLDDIKERLLTALSTLLSSSSQNTPAAVAARAFAPLSLGSESSSSSASATSPAGILLYGPPGCGKTLLVRALATTARVPCLVVTPSVLLRKFVGETNSQVRTLFSLAHKLAPCILCIDELDGLFRERNEHEHEVSRDLKTEFLQWWDGMLSTGRNGAGSSSRFHLPHLNKHHDNQLQHRSILVIGASNRPFDVDAAVLRRLPQSHFVGLPDITARRAFLHQILSQVPTDSHLNLDAIAVETEGYSPSDLKQLVQTAALMGPLRHSSTSSGSARPLTTMDLMHALPHAPPTPLSLSYRMALQSFCFARTRGSPAAINGFQFRDTGTSRQPFIMPSVPSRSVWNRVESPSAGSDTDGEILVWETELGNFYDVGTLRVDSSTFDALTELVNKLEDWSESEDDDHSTSDGEEDSDEDESDED